MLIQIRRLKYCVCGCGETIRQFYFHKDGKHKPDLSKSRFISGHNSQFIKHPSYFGKEASHWKGGKIKHSLGYIWILKRDHPFADKKGYVLEHRLVMEKHIGRYLTDKELVHHKDGNTSNNDISNLQIMTRAEHNKHHMTGNKYASYRYRQRGPKRN